MAARFLEEKGLSTLVLSPTWEFHRAVGIPRTAAIEYPYGRPVGQVRDPDGQKRVLIEALSIFEKAKTPGEVFHLPFTWPEDPKKTEWQPPEMSPLIRYYIDEIKKIRKNV